MRFYALPGPIDGRGGAQAWWNCRICPGSPLSGHHPTSKNHDMKLLAGHLPGSGKRFTRWAHGMKKTQTPHAPHA